MNRYIKEFNTHQEYEAFTATTDFVLPNVSLCMHQNEVHYNPLVCDEMSIYDIIGSPSYPSTVDGNDDSFDIVVSYVLTHITTACSETETEGTDTITVEIGQNPSTSSARTVSGTVDFHGNEIEYSVTQNRYVITLIGNFNVTSTTYPTQIASATSIFSKIEIDGVEQPRVTTGYTFSTTGDHTVKYYLNGTSIGSEAFTNCYSLESIDIPNGVTSISDRAFTYCSGLTSIDIPDSVTSIGDGAFYYCSGLTSCTIGSGVTSIGDNAFAYCRSLDSIDIPDSVTGIGDNSFYNCSGLTSCTIGSGITSISNGTFWLCRNLKRINSYIDGTFNIPSGITSIGDKVFIACYSLKSIDIPDSVTSIGFTTFQGCTSLESITSNAVTAPTIQSDTFYNVKTNGILYVPIGSSGYDVWMQNTNYYLGLYNWTKVEQ